MFRVYFGRVFMCLKLKSFMVVFVIIQENPSKKLQNLRDGGFKSDFLSTKAKTLHLRRVQMIFLSSAFFI